MKYRREDLIERMERGEKLAFIPFWGHTPNPKKVNKACLSQWYDCAFEVDGVRYHTAEQYMMAQKAVLFHDRQTYERIMAANDPADYKALGREVQGFESETWERAKYGIVLTGNLAKFGQNPELWSYLDSTNESVLVEASPIDDIWGVKLGMDDPGIEDPKAWRGRNLLGFALMEARDILHRWEWYEDCHEDGTVWDEFIDCYIKDGDPPDYTVYEGFGIYRQDGLYGIRHPNYRTIVTTAQYDDCESMKTGFIRGEKASIICGGNKAKVENAVYFVRVRRLDRYGVVDSEGRVVTPCKWDWIDAYGNARLGELWGYVNLITGEETAPQWPCSQDLRPGRRVWCAENEIDWEMGFFSANHVTHWEMTMELFRESK